MATPEFPETPAAGGAGRDLAGGRAPSPLPVLPPGWPSWREVVRLALDQAFLAGQAGEVPVGAVVLSRQGEVLARAGNGSIAGNDPMAHAEILALRQACRAVGNYRLDGAILAVTLEPCLMCLGAMVHARIGGLVYGAPDPKAGAVDSCLSGLDLPFLNHRFPVLGGVLADDCSGALKRFFLARRKDGGIGGKRDGGA
jgi:tRNA(adenine34) deaminase